MALEGWEVKSIRAGRVQLKEAYVIVKGAEIFLFGAHISPLPTASTHIKPDPVRDRKLLMHADEISKLIGKVEPCRLYARSAEYAFFKRADQM